MAIQENHNSDASGKAHREENKNENGEDQRLSIKHSFFELKKNLKQI